MRNMNNNKRCRSETELCDDDKMDYTDAEVPKGKQTVMEKFYGNNAKFVVERSSSGKNFKARWMLQRRANAFDKSIVDLTGDFDEVLVTVEREVIDLTDDDNEENM